MRISDWSSDVCSSDLQEGERVEDGAGASGDASLPVLPVSTGAIADGEIDVLNTTSDGARGVTGGLCASSETGPSDMSRIGETRQIGRASCRDIGCQNV